MATAALAALPAASSAAATDHDRFQDKVDRYTSDSSLESKRLCVCIDDENANDEQMAGVLIDTMAIGTDGLMRIQVRCFVRRFTADGAATTSGICNSTWAPLH